MISITITSDNAERIREELRTFLNDAQGISSLVDRLTEKAVGGIDRSPNPYWKNAAEIEAERAAAEEGRQEPGGLSVSLNEEKDLVEAAVEARGAEKPTIVEKKRGRRSNAEIAAAKAIAEKNAKAAEPVDEAPAEKILYEPHVMDALKSVCGEEGHGVARARALLAEFGVTRLREIPEERWGEFVSRAAAIVGGAE